jgi:hypothetical protein
LLKGIRVCWWSDKVSSITRFNAAEWVEREKVD